MLYNMIGQGFSRGHSANYIIIFCSLSPSANSIPHSTNDLIKLTEIVLTLRNRDTVLLTDSVNHSYGKNRLYLIASDSLLLSFHQ